MFPTAPGNYNFNAALADEGGTYRLMADIAAVIEPGDVVTLSGDLGAGKTTFARALIRLFAGDESIEVPSPTFTLTQTYVLPRFTLYTPISTGYPARPNLRRSASRTPPKAPCW